MEAYGYTYPMPYPPMRIADGDYPDHGDGFGGYYGGGHLKEERGSSSRRSRSKQRRRKAREGKKSRTRSASDTKSRSRSLSRSRSRSKSRSRSRSRSHSRSRSLSHASQTCSHTHSATRPKEFNYKEPGFLDAFRVLYLTNSRSKKNPSKFLATKKRQDRIQEVLKRDGLGSKRWLFYPRTKNCSDDQPTGDVPGSRDNCDQRVKVDGEFFRKYKRSKKVDYDAPIAKLKRWELVFYKKLGFVQAI